MPRRSENTRRRTLQPYRARRDFSRTSEPKGETAAAGGGWSYVIQKHDARRLHFDFRLELDGVLKSWAVARGPSLDPSQKRLAIRTEDHPLEYGEFEGIIPAGEYGGGTVMLWDRGYWEPHSDPHQGLRRGNLKFTLHGRRLRGGFALVRMQRREDAPRRRAAPENWLLIKEKDAWADRELDPVARWDRSVASRRGMAAIARAADRIHTSTPLPEFVPPQLATLVEEPPAGERWLHEIKFDGYRVLVAVAGGRARVDTRTGLDWTARFTGIARACAALEVEEALIDGEAVVLDGDGISHFALLQQAMKNSGNGASIVLMAFDLLRLDGRDLRPLPLLQRKRRLKALLKDAPGGLHYSDHQLGDGRAVRSEACHMGLEGIVSKRADLPYVSGRGRAWTKSKCAGREEFVIGGFRPSSARDRPFASLLIGEYVDGRLMYRGRVGAGFDAAALAELGSRFRRLARRNSPFDAVPPAISRQARWVSPQLVAEILYTERTPDGVLRHPRFLGLRRDKAARDVIGRPAP